MRRAVVPSPLAQALGARLRQFREERCLTLCHVAALVRLTHQQVSRIERGLVNIPIETLGRFALVYQVALPMLLMGLGCQ